MIKAIIFDLGDVCFSIDWIKINEKMVKRFGISTLVKSSGNEKALKYYTEALEGKRDIEDMFKELDKKRHNIIEVIKFYKELYKKYKKPNKKILKLIKQLRLKVRIICLSDTNRIHFEAHKEQKSLKDFDEVFTSFKLGSRKSNKDTFIKILRKLGIKPKEAIFIDDNENNIENAKSMGINGIKYENYEQLVNELKKYNL